MSQQQIPPQPILQPQPQFVMMPPAAAERNALGAFGFFVALVGLLVPTGIVSLLGLALCLAAIGRAPRGFAATGVVLGLLGSVFWLAVMVVAFAVGLVAAVGILVFSAGAFVLTQPEVVEVTSDMVNVAVAVEEYKQDHDGMPESLTALSLGVASTIDPWGGTYKLVATDEDPGFDIISGGPDGLFETDDDVRLTRLDRLWENAFDTFDERMEEFGRKIEAAQHARYGRVDHRVWNIETCPGQSDPGDYEIKARKSLARDDHAHD